MASMLMLCLVASLGSMSDDDVRVGHYRTLRSLGAISPASSWTSISLNPAVTIGRRLQVTYRQLCRLGRLELEVTPTSSVQCSLHLHLRRIGILFVTSESGCTSASRLVAPHMDCHIRCRP